MAKVRRFRRVTGRGWARSATAGRDLARLWRAKIASVVLAHGQFLRVPPETPSVRSIRTTSPLVSAQAQFGRTEQAIHDVVRRTESVVHQLPIALRADHEQRRQLALRDARRELDVDLLAIVESAQRLPRRIAATDRIAKADLLQRQASIDRRGGAGRLRLALQGQHLVLRILPGHRRHPRLLSRSQFNQVRAPAGRDDQIGLEARADRLDHHIDAQRIAAAARCIAHDPAHGIAGGHRYQFLTGLERDHRHATHGRIDLIQRAIGERPHLNRVDVPLARGRDTRLGVGAGHTHGFIGRFCCGLGIRHRLHLSRHRQHLRHGHHLHRRRRLR